MQTETEQSALDRTLAATALAGVGVFVVLVLLLHPLKTHGYNISTDAVSLYAVGDFGSLMTIAFVGMGLGHLGLAAALHRRLRRWLGPSFLTLVGVCLLVSAVFETDPRNTDPPTTHGLIHNLVGLLVFIIMALTPLVFAVSLRRTPGWARLTRASLTFGVATTAAFLAMPLGFRDAYFGIGQRIFLALYVSWLTMMALALAGMSGRRSGEAHPSWPSAAPESRLDRTRR
jgi:hypothetical protein